MSKDEEERAFALDWAGFEAKLGQDIKAAGWENVLAVATEQINQRAAARTGLGPVLYSLSTQFVLSP